MTVLSNLTIVDKSGNTVFQVDHNGVRDGSSRVATKTIETRLFATPLAAYMWTCIEGVWQVQAVNAKVSVTGGSGCTVDVLVSSGVVAPAGTTQLTGAMDIEATAPFSVNGVLIASPTLILPGDSVSRVIAGTVGSLEGLLTVQLKRIS
jgi:hypothetical protein